MSHPHSLRQPWAGCRALGSAAAAASRSCLTTARLQHPGSTSVFSLVLFTILLIFTSPGLAQKDPVTNFCRRFGHQTAVVDRKLYVDGGFLNYAPLLNNPTNYTNTFLSYHDLDHNGDADMPQLYSNLSKNATIPSVSGGILWADDVNKNFYLFGGEYYQTPPSELSLYNYDTINNYWTVIETPETISGVSYGAGASISELGEAFYYGGWLSSNSVPGYSGARMATPGLVRYDMDENRWTNMTGPDDTGRAEGAMVYIPASDGGMLVYFGGTQDPKNGTLIGQPMDEIFVFDMASSRWYKQVASGAVPGMRARFCAGATWVDDQSSYDIYLYGGLGMPNYTAGYDDVYVLSLPSFTWIKMYPNTTLEQYPHNSLSCNVVDRSQMLIIGGSFPLDDTTCDAPTQFGAHSLDMGEQNADASPGYYADTLQWFVYRKNITDYIVPSIISNVIGGNAQGAATKTTPDGGFDEPDLRILMSRKYTAPVRSPTRDVSPSSTPTSASLSKGAIAGIAVGAAAAGIAMLAAIWFCCRRHRRRNRQFQKTTPGMSSVRPMHSQIQSGPGSMWSPGSSHRTPGPPSPYGGNGPTSLFGHASPHAPAAIIPNHPVEMPGHAHDYGASEMHNEGIAPYSTVSRGGGGGVETPLTTEGLVSPYSAGSDPTKVGREDWPSPIVNEQPIHHHQPANRGLGNDVYAAGGYGPQELSSDPSADRADAQHHNTFYHS